MMYIMFLFCGAHEKFVEAWLKDLLLTTQFCISVGQVSLALKIHVKNTSN